MSNFNVFLKKAFFFCIKYFWVILLLIFVGYLLNQSKFSYSKEDVEIVANNTLEKEEDVIFVVIEESFFGDKNGGFKSLRENLETFDFDKKNNMVYLKHNNHLPYYSYNNNGTIVKDYTDTKIIVVYDKGQDSFERYTEVVSLSTFPYTYYLDNKKLFTIEAINEDGTVFMNFNEKTIQLDNENNYSNISFTDFQLTKTKITNYGIFKKDSFVKLKTENEILEEQKEAEKKQKEKEEKIESGEDKLILPNIHNTVRP